jgi:alkylation response protein AidB-like acyl-CoA dehydrogenase
MVAHFNEVFLSDVRLPASNVVGEVNGGWAVARTTLASERGLIGGGAGGTTWGFPQVADLARRFGRAGDPVARQALAALFGRTQVLRYLGLRSRTAASQGRPPGPETSVMKLAYSRHVAASADLVVALQRADGMLLDEAAADGGFLQHQFLGHSASRIGGGTDEVQRNVIGERVLGLPAEPRADRDVPFSALVRA